MIDFIVDQLFGGYLLAALPFAIFAGIISFLSLAYCRWFRVISPMPQASLNLEVEFS